ncbi:hypothetical protein AG1IA_07488 [Rhizoctonia solani AG-1 IA]|uniref:T6SS Phospholipase effector Tle1-like catalytic domain-containing protein n=1 Tax=Thanatephorus cucumeris (strain AG1-IA) TaxID=983506 RepID=L8WKK8_THACA|nr:hypothetical protein AG1IA_07488 [Rhizoctonia solani AG-1 IA]
MPELFVQFFHSRDRDKGTRIAYIALSVFSICRLIKSDPYRDPVTRSLVRSRFRMLDRELASAHDISTPSAILNLSVLSYPHPQLHTMSSDAPARPEPTAVQPGPSETTISFPQVIPPVDGLALSGRSLVLCFDGTGDQYDHDNSNIVRFVQLLKKDDKKRQMVYYQTGIGTGVGPQPSGVFTSKLSQTLDTMIASGLGDHVRGGYEFLMQNYNEGDRISIFGFSRGAYTARALAGMLHKVGLLPAYNHEQVAFAYKMFKRDDEEGWKMSNGFKRAFCIDVKIDFVGVFDTVNSVGIIPRELPFAKSNYLIRVFRHAVALDEHRAKFQPNLWGRSTESEEKLGEAGKKKVYHRQKSKSGVWSYVSGWGSSGQLQEQGKQPDAKAKAKAHSGGHDFTTVADRGHQTDVKGSSGLPVRIVTLAAAPYRTRHPTTSLGSLYAG